MSYLHTTADCAVVDGVLGEIRAERARQDAKWGEQNHPDGTGPDVEWAIRGPASRIATMARRLCQQAAREGTSTWLDIAREEISEAFELDDPAKLRAELIQCAAVFTQWAEAIDRRGAQR
jgi:hypothetical protein